MIGRSKTEFGSELGLRPSSAQDAFPGIRSSSAQDAFLGISQAGLVLEAYVKVTFAYGRREEDTK